MSMQRRYYFRASAAAFGGHIIRPQEVVVESHGASALTVSGGRCISKVGPPAKNEWFFCDGADTSAEGVFENRDQYLASTNGAAASDSLVAVTTVRADVRGVVHGQKAKLTAKRLTAQLTARSSVTGGHPSIQLGEVGIDGVDINGHRLIVELNPGPFRQIDTYAKLLVAADSPDFVKASSDAFAMRAAFTGDAPPRQPPSPRLFEVSCGTLYASIVKSIRWDGDPYPNARIDGNRVIVEPDFGVIYFGELLISEYSRRLTMLRCALGSESGGAMAACDVEDNGGWGWSI